MQAFALSYITSPLDEVSTLPFLLEADAVEYYHSLTKQVQDDWFELMRVLGHRFDCISHEPVYLSRGISLDMRTALNNFELALSSRSSTPVTSRWVTSLTLDLLKGCRLTLCADSTSSRSVPNGVQGDHFASTRLWRPLPRLTWQLAIKLRRFRTHRDQWETPQVLHFRDHCL